jgi:lipooligosaccharide transport system permease protein
VIVTLPAIRVVQHNLHTFRHIWRSYLSSVVGPLLFLVALGAGVGQLIDQRGGVDGMSYLNFLAPGLMVGVAMQTGALAGFGPILGRIRWDPVYESMLHSPLRIPDVLLGELLWIGLRLTATSSVFLAAMAALGAAPSWWAVLTLPVAVLTGLSVAAVFTAIAAFSPNGYTYDVVSRVVIVPLLLFGGVFFPFDRLPSFVRVAFDVTPLPHGVALAREFTAGTPTLPSLVGHLAVLVVYLVGGFLLARHAFRKRLVP